MSRSWNPWMSNFGPSAACAFARNATILSIPILYPVAWPGSVM